MIDDVINAVVAVGLCRGFCRLFVTREKDLQAQGEKEEEEERMQRKFGGIIMW